MRRCCFWIPFAALAACSTFEVTPFLREQITGDTWRACLAREYQSQARAQARNGRHWSEATYLADKGRATLLGEEVTLDAAPESLQPRSESLAAVLHLRGRRCSCAVAQARLDGWVQALAQDPGRDQGPYATAFDTALHACGQQD